MCGMVSTDGHVRWICGRCCGGERHLMDVILHQINCILTLITTCALTDAQTKNQSTSCHSTNERTPPASSASNSDNPYTMKKSSTILLATITATYAFTNHHDHHRTPTHLHQNLADPSSARSASGPKVDFKGGAGVGRLVFADGDTPIEKWECKYDMILVERLQDRPKTESGLFVPRENLPK